MSMLEQTGARRQEALRGQPALERISNVDRILRGAITLVKVMDHPDNKASVTLVDITLYGGYPDIENVPVMHAKINNQNGEEWSPDSGDIVLVAFINGNFWEPVVIGYLPLPENLVEAKMADVPKGKRRYHMRCNKTDIVIDKDGNRTTYVSGNETVKIKNSEIVTVETGDITVEVAQGKCTVHIKGKTAWTSDGTIELDGGAGAVKGVVQGDSVCAYTGKPHPHISATVKASK